MIRSTNTLAILIVLCGCSSPWRSVNQDSGVVLRPGEKIRVKLLDDSIIETNNYVFEADTLIIAMPKTLLYESPNRKIPLNQIVEIKVQRPGPGQERIFFFSAIVLSLFIWFFISVSSASHTT